MADEATAEAEAPEATAAPVPAEQESVDWKSESRKHERRAKDNYKELQTLQQRFTEIEESSKSESEKMVERAKAEGRDEAAVVYRGRIRESEIRAAAAGRFANPANAVKLVEVSDDDLFDTDGNVQTAALTKALDDLLEAEPHLKTPQGGKPQGDVGAGQGTGLESDSGDMNALIRRRAGR